MKTTHRVEHLLNEVEDLLAELRDEHGPEVAELRARVEQTAAAARQTIGSKGKTAYARARVAVRAVDDYITSYPRIGFLTGVAVGGVLVYLVNVLSPKE